ncbi:MAG TPA: DNA/RNA nuclease SfsA [Alcanivoracaceae bacterium]|nr:DNA/RNA nuclease SfsA [Alcanivoracaceae bacterium]
MKLDESLEQGTLVKRYKRFMADVITATGETLTIHCPNTGSMKNCLIPSAAVLYSDSHNPKRKLRHTWEAVQVAHGHWAGINTHRANNLVEEALRNGLLEEYAHMPIRREVKWGDSRFDFAVGEEDAQVLLEVKNVTLGPSAEEADTGIMYFPDAVTTRGQKHVETLTQIVAEGGQAGLIYCVQHTGAKEVRPAAHIDPDYAALLKRAAEQGVQIRALKAHISPDEIVLVEEIPVVLD